MKIITNLVPGSPAWLQARSASKAPAVMGASQYQTRSELLKQMATTVTKEVDAATQRRFDDGHRTEALAREIAEDILGEPLSPIAGSTDDDYLTASFDGLTFDGDVAWEHKLWNEELAAAVRADNLPEAYRWQMDQQILVGGLDYVLFMVSDGTREKCVSLEYRSSPERAARLLANWKQFDADLAAYQHVEAVPEVTAAPIADLPALVVEISGNVTASNLAEWKQVVTGRIAGINTDLQDDQDFADADKMVKFLDDGEKRIDLVKAQAQSKAADIDAVFRALDEIKATMRSKRLELDKLVKMRKESIKVDIVQVGKTALAAHISSLNKRLGRVQMPAIQADWGTAIKGKRNLEAMRGAVADLVAEKKLESNEIADRIDANLKTLALETEHQFLFSDIASLAMKAPDDLAVIIKSRIQDHKISEEKRLASERERIRIEEEAKAAAKAKAEQEAAEAQRKAAEEAAAKIERDRVATIAANLGPDRVQPTEPAAPAAPGASSPRLDETPKAAAPTHKGITGTAKLRDEIDDLLVDFDAVELLAAIQSLRSIKARRDTREAA